MKPPSLHKALALNLALIILLILSACQGQTLNQPETVQTSISNLEATASPTLPPTETPTPTARPTATDTPEPAETPLPTETPTQTRFPSPTAGSPTPEPLCFTSGQFPFAFSPDGSRLYVQAQVGVQTLDASTYQQQAFLAVPVTSTLGVIALSPDGATIALARDDFSIQLIKTANLALQATLSGHTATVTKLKFTPDSSRLFSTSHDNTMKIWDLDGNLLNTFQPPDALGNLTEVMGFGFSPDGRLLATIPFDGPVTLWSMADFSLVQKIGGNGGYNTTDIVFSPDGQYIASDTVNGLFLWHLPDGKQLLGGNPGINTMAVAFSPDGKYLAFDDISDVYEIQVTSPDGSQVYRTLPGNPAPTWEMFFSPDGSLLVSVNPLDTRIWRVEDSTLLAIGKADCGAGP